MFYIFSTEKNEFTKRKNIARTQETRNMLYKLGLDFGNIRSRVYGENKGAFLVFEEPLVLMHIETILAIFDIDVFYNIDDNHIIDVVEGNTLTTLGKIIKVEHEVDNCFILPTKVNNKFDYFKIDSLQ